MSLETNSFEFDEFRLDAREKILRRQNERVSITPKTFQLLLFLVENHGRLVEKDELMKTVWAGSFVEESNLSFTMGLLRKALGDEKTNPRFIETVQRRGYRFIAEVKTVGNSTGELSTGDGSRRPLKAYLPIAAGLVLLSFLFGGAVVWFRARQSKPARQSARLTTSGKVTNAAVSPDGNYLVFAQKEAGGESLWRQRIATGEQTRILPPEEVEFVGLTVAPGGDYVYYSLFSENRVTSALSRVALTGGRPEPLPNISADVSVSFSPDGKRFAYTDVQRSISETRLKTADADGSNQKLLLTTKGDRRAFSVFRASPVAWSPDGKTIACAVQETDESGTFSKILLVDADDGTERYLSDKHWDFVETIVWQDAASLALVNVDPKSRVSRLWQISGRTGEARQLTDDLSGYRWLAAAGGNLFTVQKTVFSNLVVADYAENTKTLQPKQIYSEAGLIENVAWSLDEKIFYNSSASGKNEIWRISPDGTAPRQLTTDSNLIFSFAVSPVDNTLVFSTLRDGRIALSAADPTGRNIRPVTDGTYDFSPSFAPDGKTVVFQRGILLATLWRAAVKENAAPAQLTGYLASHPAVSPDGRQIAYHFMDHSGDKPHWKLALIDSGNHRLLNKLDFPVPITERNTVWHPKNNLLTMTFATDGNAGILLLSPADGSFQVLEKIAAGRISSFGWSPDGDRFAFSQNFEINDVISLSGF